MRSFLIKYRAFLLFLPGLWVLGQINPRVAILGYLLFALRLAAQGRRVGLIILMVLTFIGGDSRLYSLEFIKPLRIVITLLLTGITTWDLVKGRYRLDRLMLPLGIFYLLALFVAFRNFSPLLSISKATSYFLLFFIALHFIQDQVRRNGIELLSDLTVLMITVVTLGLLGLIFYPDIVNYGYRFRGLMGNPNGLGIYLTLSVPLLWLFTRQFSTQFSRLVLAGMWGVVFLSLIISGSRTAMGATLLFFFGMWLYQGPPIKRLVFYVGMVPLLWASLNLETIVDWIRLLQLEEFIRVESLIDFSGRIHAWEFGIEEIQNYPVLGRGFAFEEILFKDFMPQWLYATGHQGAVHNSWLAFLLNVGVVGLSILIFVFGIMFFRIKNVQFRMGVLFLILLSGTFESWLTSSLNAFTIHFLLLLLLGSKILRKESLN